MATVITVTISGMTETMMIAATVTATTADTTLHPILNLMNFRGSLSCV